MNTPTPEKALARLEANPALAREFDEATRREHPAGTTRREAVAHCISQALAVQAEAARLRASLAAKRAAIARLEQSPKSTAQTRPAPLETLPPGLRDKRQVMPITQWAFGHLTAAAERGDAAATAELARRGFTISAAGIYHLTPN